jgi:ribosome-associated protein
LKQSTTKSKSKQKLADVSANLSAAIVSGMQEKKAKDITVLNLKNIESAVTDYFVICTGESNTQVAAIANAVRIEVQKLIGEPPFHEEGYNNSQWILLDYINVVAHVFQPETRMFYALEKLWSDAEKTIIND